MFKKILIANRGEIALRIIRTCKEMGVHTVAVYSDLDSNMPFLYSADEAYPLNGKTSLETYLRAEKILEIAKETDAQAIHPGYGFLAENAEFARQVTDAGLVFIGPPPDAIDLMGSKTAARKLMINAGVPVVPGTESAISDINEAKKIADDIGYPILIKASAGGGGKGMRRVESENEFVSAVEGAQREAGSAFGDSAVYIEKYLEEPRHIEFQILADNQGNVIHLGERECSIQRRHQKIVEESPSVLLDDKLRKMMGEAAVQAAKACGYRNAGTIEFLVDKHRKFYFLEMNTRLQVEHPVTELVTGLDLVREQLLIAFGEEMTLSKNVECFWGHSIECRIYAENPENNFAPSPGFISYLNPPHGPGVREDGGVTSGNEISLYYDPMISKLIVWAHYRAAAIDKMIRALSEYEIQGIITIIPFLKRVMDHSHFRKGNFTTNFINEHPELFDGETELTKTAAIAAILLHQIEKNKKRLPLTGNQEFSKWKSIKRQKSLD
ncbi:acetyl/propionyl/methylcrotonyl-CoA carboxylase subunit alpha [Calditrichota bacterium]